MRARPLAWVWTVTMLVTGCHLIGGTEGLYIIDEDPTVGSGGATSSSSSSAGGSSTGEGGVGGQPILCTEDICVGSDGPCRVCSCSNDLTSCQCTNAEPYSACDRDPNVPGTDGVCFGSECVDCVENMVDDCPPEKPTCQVFTCIPEGCDNMQKDGTETDTDCGGSCAKCQNGQSCISNTDCQSSWCAGGTTCAACSGDSDCGSSRYCRDGVCHPKKPDFSSCGEGLTPKPNWCQSGHCCLLLCSPVAC